MRRSSLAPRRTSFSPFQPERCRADTLIVMGLRSGVCAVRFLAWLVVLALVGACASLPHDVERNPSRALGEFDETALGRRVQAVQPDPKLSGFRLLPSGDTAYQLRLTLIDEAVRTLDLQYYTVERDASTRALFVHLRRAAERGVRIRLLLDDLNTVTRDANLARFAKHPRIEVRLFNPFPAGRGAAASRFLFAAADLPRLTRRMHNKLFVADNALAITGGRNLGAAYFQSTGDINFADLDVLVGGAAVRELSRTFDRYWNSKLTYPIEALASGSPPATPAESSPVGADPAAGGPIRARQPLNLHLVWASSRVVVDRPSKVAHPGPGRNPTVTDDVLTLIQNATQSVTLVSPYFVPSPELTGVLRELRSRSVTVRVLTNSLATTDMPAAQVAYAGHRLELLSMGVELYELRPTSGGGPGFLGSGSGSGSSKSTLHAKAALVDDRWLFVGSMNLDSRSALENTEVGVIIDSRELGAHLARIMKQGTDPSVSYALRLAPDGRTIQWVTHDSGREAVHTHDPEAGFWRSLLATLLYGAVPEALL